MTSSAGATRVDRCEGCGGAVEGGTAGCRAIFERLIARDYGDPAYYAAGHRLLVDTYALQHPEPYCRSAKSLAAHLCGLCQILERGASPTSGDSGLTSWLDGRLELSKPDVPAARGELTIVDVATATDAGDVADHARAVRRWAESTWTAYAPLHDLARAWIARAESEGGRARRR